jgi:hypothetical protein
VGVEIKAVQVERLTPLRQFETAGLGDDIVQRQLAVRFAVVSLETKGAKGREKSPKMVFWVPIVGIFMISLRRTSGSWLN